MSSISELRSQPSPTEGPPPVRLRTWPLGEHPVRGLILLLAIGAVFSVIWRYTSAPSMVLLSVAAMLASLWRFFVPVVYELNLEGVHQRFLGRRRQLLWRSVARYQALSRGILILPDIDNRPIDVLGGLYVPWDDHREEVLSNFVFYVDGRRPRRAD